MEAFFVTLAAVAIGEIGDKTQLLSLLLAARFRRPVPIVLGILCATLANHALAAAAGVWLRELLDPRWLRWVLGLSFLAIAGWTLVPDRAEDEAAPDGAYGVFAVTLVAFFLAEMGDKTQLATLVLATNYDSLLAVVAGSTLGMLCADVPAVLLACAAPRAIPLKAIRLAAAGFFAALGVAALAFG